MSLGLALIVGDLILSLVAEVVKALAEVVKSFAEVEEAKQSFEFIALVGDVVSEIM